MPQPADYLEMAAHRVLPDGRGLFVYPQITGIARLGIGALDDDGMTDVW